jgi:hypothetical protein
MGEGEREAEERGKEIEDQRDKLFEDEILPLVAVDLRFNLTNMTDEQWDIAADQAENHIDRFRTNPGLEPKFTYEILCKKYIALEDELNAILKKGGQPRDTDYKNPWGLEDDHEDWEEDDGDGSVVESDNSGSEDGDGQE